MTKVPTIWQKAQGRTFRWGRVDALQHDAQAVQTGYGGTQIQRFRLATLQQSRHDAFEVPAEHGIKVGGHRTQINPMGDEE